MYFLVALALIAAVVVACYLADDTSSGTIVAIRPPALVVSAPVR